MADVATDGEALRKEAQKWLDRIDASASAEKIWMDDADQAVKAYTGEGNRVDGSSTREGKVYDFNILFSNVETIVPAIINSAPAPDIRRRFAQQDAIGRDYAELLERCIRVQTDDSKLQVELEAMAQDAFLAGRGVVRLRFKSEFESVVDDKAELEAAVEDDDYRDDKEPSVAPEQVKNEQICFEVVSWRDFRRGPAKRWDAVPWEAFRIEIDDDDLSDFADPVLVNAQRQEDERDEPGCKYVIWEVWDKRTRSVIFVDGNKKRIIKRVTDPLGLTKFFPTHDPVQAIEVTGRLMPVNPFSIYRKLADELDETTKRINVITKQLKVKGWYSGDADDLKNVLDAGDNEWIPLANAELWAAKGGVENAVAFWPVDKLIGVLRELYVLREQTKQAIYEITGISDIVRGASRSGETATAQQIKTQWGSLRIQKMQRQIERAARDLFVMMAEVIPAKFTVQTLEKITGIQLVPTQQDLEPIHPPPPPVPQQGMDPQQAQQMQAQAEQAAKAAQEAEKARQAKLQHIFALNAMLQEKTGQFFRIDVESDSTVKADLTRQKQEATEFMGAAGQYFQAVAPLVQQGVLPMNIAVEIFGSFSRLFNLGKSVEDALDELIQMANAKAKQPQQQQPSPEQIKAESEAKARDQEMQVNAQKAQLEAADRQQDMQFKAGKNALDMQNAQIGNKAAAADLASKTARAEVDKIDLALKRAEAAGLFGIPLQPGQPAINGAALPA